MGGVIGFVSLHEVVFLSFRCDVEPSLSAPGIANMVVCISRAGIVT